MKHFNMRTIHKHRGNSILSDGKFHTHIKMVNNSFISYLKQIKTMNSNDNFITALNTNTIEQHAEILKKIERKKWKEGWNFP